MKKLSVISMAALMLASCSSDDMQGPAGTGSEQEVSLSFQLPTEIGSRAQGGTDSSKGGATNCTGEVTFTVELSYGNTVVFSESKSTAIPNANASVTFRPTLILGENYNLVAYAQFDGAVTDLTAIEENGSINDETVDAYYNSSTIKAAPQMSATLKRHTGKLRIIADDFAEWQRQTGKTIQTIKVAYKQAQATKFNAETGVWDATTAQTKEFTADWTTYTNEAGEKTIMVDYIPASATGEIINIESVTVTTTDNWTFTKALATLDVPVKRNYLTTLKGNFFTSGTELKVEIDDAFEGEENVSYELLSAFENGGIVTLTEDVTLDEPLVAKAGKNVVLNLDGATITNKLENSNPDVIFVEEGATLTINGNGTIEAVNGNEGYPIFVYGVLNINDGKFITGYDHVNNGNTCVYARGNGEVNIYGGDFSSKSTITTYLINIKDEDRATAKINIYGGTFHGFNPANNAAEGVGTNFVADGYDVIANGDVYTVVKI